MLLGGSNLAIRVVSLFSTVVIMRILNPEDFGIVGYAMIILSTASLFSGLSMGTAVIHSQEDRRRVAFHAFVISAITGFLLFLIIQLNAYTFAELLGATSVVPILRWMTFLVPLATLVMVPDALMQKEQLFERTSIIGLSVEALYIVSSVGLAMAGFGLWSLVYSALLKAVVTVVLTWWLCPGWDWLLPQQWDWQLSRRLLGFGLSSTLGGITSFLYSIADNYLVGKNLGASALGIYQKAYDFTIRTVFGLSGTVGAVLFTSYAKIQNDNERLSQAYLKSLGVLALVTVPLSMGIFVTASEMVTLLLKQEWRPAIPVLEVLAFVGLIMPLSASTAALFFAKGRPAFNMRAGLVVLVVMIPLIFAFFSWGIVGVAFAVLCAHVAGFLFNVYQVHLILKKTASRMFRAVLPSLLGTAVMMVCIQLSKAPLLALSGGAHTITTIITMILIGMLSYGIAIYFLQRAVVLELTTLLLGQFKRKKREEPQETHSSAEKVAE